ncbi:MAG: hypothetical protein AB7F40_04960 [Victivallaceae bacterium]
MLAAQILTDEQLAEIESDLKQQESDLRKSMIDGLKNEVILAQFVFYSTLEGPCNVIDLNGIEQPFRNPIGAPIYCYLQNEHVFLLKIYKQAISEITAPEFDQTRGIKVLDEWEKTDGAEGGRHIFAAMLLPSLSRAWMMESRQEAMLRMMRIACAIERYRLKNHKLPASLEELAMPDMPLDPFNQHPFGYECGELTFWKCHSWKMSPVKIATATGYRLYSVGPDRKNDGGKLDNIDTGDIVVSVADPGTYVECTGSDPEE